jgi:hypothetical protein
MYPFRAQDFVPDEIQETRAFRLAKSNFDIKNLDSSPYLLEISPAHGTITVHTQLATVGRMIERPDRYRDTPDAAVRHTSNATHRDQIKLKCGTLPAISDTHGAEPRLPSNGHQTIMFRQTLAAKRPVSGSG